MAQTPPIAIRTDNPAIIAFLKWLREHELKQSSYLREWIETGFSLWLLKTAILDPGLYAEIVALIAESEDPVEAAVLAHHGTEALRETIHILVSSLGGFQPTRSQRSRAFDTSLSDSEPQEGIAEEDVGFLDVGDDLDTY